MHLSNNSYFGGMLLRLLLEDVLSALQVVGLFEALHLFIISTYNPLKFLFISHRLQLIKRGINGTNDCFSYIWMKGFLLLLCFRRKIRAQRQAHPAETEKPQLLN